MTFHEFIFSSYKPHQVKRHLAFWAVYSVYFYLQSISPDCIKGLERSQVFSYAFNSLFCFLPACILCVYVLLYVLYPMFLRRKHYTAFFAALLLLFGATVCINYFFSILFLQLSCNCDTAGIIFMRKFALGFLNSQNAIIAGCLALGIKLTINWYVQKQENILLAREKMKTTLGNIRKKIRPDYFFLSLNMLRQHIKAKRPDSADMIINFSELLSYWLYEADEELVTLEHDLSVIRKFIALEEARQGCVASAHITVSGKTADVYIVPMVLLPFVEWGYTVTAVKKNRNQRLQLLLTNINQRLLVDLTVYGVATKDGMDISHTEPVQNAINRLMLFYHNDYSLDIKEESDQVKILLTVPVISARDIQQKQSIFQSSAPAAYEPV
jgi:two-component system, LytTR family, sensor kinase